MKYLALLFLMFVVPIHGQTTITGALRDADLSGSAMFGLDYRGTYENGAGVTEISLDTAYGVLWTDQDGTSKQTDRFDASLMHTYPGPASPFVGFDIRSDWRDALYMPYLYRIDPPRAMRLKHGVQINGNATRLRVALAAEKRRGQHDLDIGVELGPEYSKDLAAVGGKLTSRTKIFYGLEQLWSLQTYNTLSLLVAAGIHVSVDYNVFVDQAPEGGSPYLHDTMVDREILVGFSYQF